jgi:hypothetical protein
LLTGPGGFNEHSRKTCKNLEAAITASKRPGFFSYYEPPDQVKTLVRGGEVERLQDQVVSLQKQIDQLSEKIDAHAQIMLSGMAIGPHGEAHTSNSPTVHNMKQWFATYGVPKQETSDSYTSFSPDKKVYGGTSHYSAFRSQASTMKKGRLTK